MLPDYELSVDFLDSLTVFHNVYTVPSIRLNVARIRDKVITTWALILGMVCVHYGILSQCCRVSLKLDTNL